MFGPKSTYLTAVNMFAVKMVKSLKVTYSNMSKTHISCMEMNFYGLNNGRNV